MGMGLIEPKELSSPGAKEDYREDGKPLEGQDHTAYRAMAARANYLALDRPDLQFAAKEICRKMSGPTEDDWGRLKKLVRYIRGKMRIAYVYHWQHYPRNLTAFTDTNWAGCCKTRR